MIFTKNFAIKFTHQNNHLHPKIRGNKFWTYKPKRGRSYTHCQIFRNYSKGVGISEKPVSTGVAICSEEDMFCKRTGRQIAFLRAANSRDHLTDSEIVELMKLAYNI